MPANKVKISSSRDTTPLTQAKPGGVEVGAHGRKNPKGAREQDEVPRGGSGIKGYEGQISR